MFTRLPLESIRVVPAPAPVLIPLCPLTDELNKKPEPDVLVTCPSPRLKVPVVPFPTVSAPVTPSVPPMVALFVTANPVPAAVKLIAVEVVAPLPVTVAKVSASAVRYDPDAW